MFDKQDAENIEILNAGSGTKHRSTPYNLSNPDDLSEAFLLIAAASMDYRRYWSQLMQMEEEADESFETYDAAAWLNMLVAPKKGDKLMVKALDSLRATTGLFEQIMDRADKNLAVLLKVIVSAPAETQLKVLGAAYNIPAKEQDARIKELLEGLDEVDTHYNVQENRDEFLGLMKSLWGEK